MPAKAPPRDEPDPSASVLAAYRAANAGQYAKADAFLDPTMVRALERVNAATLAASRRLRRLLSGLDPHGSVIRDTEPVVRQQGRWLLG